ncbi:hypothetical protein KY358_04155 [Candidatus Woesearchaeota archaeon]|nr:hypothetical protein [Candidatus Woesearchaeota archaeon]
MSGYKKTGKAIIMILAVLALSALVYSAACTDSGLTFTAQSNNIPYGQTRFVRLSCSECSGEAPGDSFGIHDNATILIDTNYITNTTSTFNSLKNLWVTNINWYFNTTALGSTTINVTIFNETGGNCSLSVDINITNSQNPNVTLSIEGLNGLVLFTGRNYTFNITLNNTGNGSAHDIIGALSDPEIDGISNPNILSFNTSIISVSSIANGSSTKLTYLLTPINSSSRSNITISTSIISMKRADGTAVTINSSTATNDAVNFTIWRSPTISTLPNISILINNNDSSLDLSGYIRAENASALNLNCTSADNLTISINSSTRIVLIVPDTNWTGARNLTFNATDSYNTTVNSTTIVFVYNSSSESCNGIDDDGDTLIDENSDNSGSMVDTSCCPSGTSCSSSGSRSCTNGSWSSCTGYSVSSPGGGGGSGGSSRSAIKTVSEDGSGDDSSVVEPVRPKPPVMQEAPKSSGGSGRETKSEPKKEPSRYEQLIEKIGDNRIKHTRTVQAHEGETRIIESFRNIDTFDADDVRITLDIPKSIIGHADRIREVTPFRVIEADPKIEFDLGSIGSKQERVIVYILEKKLTPEEIENIILKIGLKEISKEERESLFNKTQEVVNITTTARVDEKKNETEFTLDIDFIDDSILHDADIYMEIPKCMIEIIDEMTIDSDFRFDIVSRDPLIVWHFTKLEKGDQLKYIIKSIADEDCLNQVKTYAIARQIVLLEAEFGSPQKARDRLIIPALSLALLVVALFVLADYLDKKKRKIKRWNRAIGHIKGSFKGGSVVKKVTGELASAGFSKKEIEDAIKYRKKKRFIQFIHRHIFGGEVLFLSVLILFNVLDFFAFLPGDMDLLKKIISWTLLSYLLYKISLMKVLFGNDRFRRFLDISLLLLFFSLIFKLVIEFATSSFNEAHYYGGLLFMLARYSVEATSISLYIGFIGLISVSLFITFFVPVKKPSFHHVITSILGKHRISKRHAIVKKTAKFLSVYMVLLLFYIIVYNFVFEWLAIAIDSSILMVVLIMTIVVFIRREYHLLICHRIKKMLRVKVSEGVEKIADVVDSFNIKFFQLLPYRKFIYLAIIGLLILHLATEAGIFIIPYVTGATSSTYFSKLGEGHTPVLNLIGPLQRSFHKETAESLLSIQTRKTALLNRILLVYLANIFAVLFLLINPLIIWLHMYREREKPAHSVRPIRSKAYSLFQLLFVMSMLSLLVIPIFKIGFASDKVFGETGVDGSVSTIRGLDIRTQLVRNDQLALAPWTLLAGALLGAVYLVLKRRYNRQATGVINSINIMMILGYISIFYIDIYRFFTGTLRHLWHTNIFFFVHFAVFFAMSYLFYTIGILLLGLELFARGEIYMPVFMIKMIRSMYGFTEKAYHHLLPDHNLPHLIFYEHHIEAEHGKKEDHLYEHVIKMIEGVCRDKKMLKRFVEKDVKEGKGCLNFIERRLLEHNWPEKMAREAVRKVEKSLSAKEQLDEIRFLYKRAKALHRLAEAVQKYYDLGCPVKKMILKIRKNRWKKDDVREMLPWLRLKKKDRRRFKKAYP